MENMKKNGISRRSFLKRAGGAAAAIAMPAVVPSSAFGRQAAPPSNRINLAVIGVGKQGGGHIRGFLHKDDVQVVAVCDVDALKLNQARNEAVQYYAEKAGRTSYEGVRAYRDFRDILDRRDVDAVLIATPDHWHVPIAMMAARSEKDIYCEKPLSLTIAEARGLIPEIRRYGRVFQTGSQQRSNDKFRLACELVRNGCIGEIREVRVSIRTGFSDHPVFCDLPAVPVPPELDWDLWLGPAPVRPYHSKIAPPITSDEWGGWRNFTDYSGGGMADWGAHHFDIAQWGLGMDGSGPVEILPPNDRDVPLLTYRYANGVPLTVDFENNFIRFTGTRGVVEVNRQYLKTKPDSLTKIKFGQDAVRLYASDDHQRDWLASIRSRKQPICDVETGTSSVTVCHLGNIAVMLRRPLKWDPAAGIFPDDPEANRLLSRPMRSPWRL
jgi:predicted dehydrogenase